MGQGKGVVIGSSLKQKLNMNSSTEGQLLGSHNGLSVVLWSKNFIEAQGYTMEHNKLYQDNKIAILV